MGQPAGVTQKEVVEASIAKHRVPDTATCIIADAIEVYLARGAETLQRAYGLSEQEWPAVLKQLKAFQRKIDPYGDWKS